MPEFQARVARCFIDLGLFGCEMVGGLNFEIDEFQAQFVENTFDLRQCETVFLNMENQIPACA